jgi:hypothetical protein
MQSLCDFVHKKAKEAAKEGESNPAKLVIARANQFAFQVSDAEFQDVEREKKDIQAMNLTMLTS